MKGIRSGKYLVSKNNPGILRIIFQMVLVPLIGITGLFIVLKLPSFIIGSTYIALLYKPDLIRSIFWLAGSVLF
ncbi:MAG: hypothetical protein KAX49_14740 [Halanaerobiales bacterium]|nr:hypothetical protein [Halanaerobiales bacterium]